MPSTEADSGVAQRLKSLEMLAQIATSILGRVGSGSDVLQRLPESACSLLGMGFASVVVLENGGKTLRLVASHGVSPPVKETTMNLDELPTVRQCIETGRPVAISDVDEAPNINRRVAELYGVKSLIQLPLIADGQSIGVMMLGSPCRRSFSEADVRLAELWSGVAAGAIATDMMHERMRESLQMQRRLLRQRDDLFTVNEAIFQAGPLQELFHRVANLAAPPLGVDVCQVILPSEKPGELVVCATTQPYGQRVDGIRYPAEGSLSGQTMQSRTTLVIENGGPNNELLHPVLRLKLPCASLVIEPLLNSAGESIGLIVLLRDRQGPFEPDQLRMTRLFAARLASTIENVRLIEQTRRDADSNAMLLRELNHRVKNNLAGIAGLLSIDPPELPPPARQWLDRVVDRIQTIARAHDMLSGGLDRVSLGELMTQTMRGLSVVTRYDVIVRQEVAGGDVLLRKDRAISVAMVLHELCYNALVHGLTGPGALRLRAALGEQESQRRLTLEVIDDGCGLSNKPVTSGHKRLGLALVRDFVRRELHGTFTIEPAPQGGTRACVQFSLLEDERAR